MEIASRGWRAAAVLGASFGLITGCGGGDDEPDPTATPSEPAATSESPAPTPAAAPSPLADTARRLEDLGYQVRELPRAELVGQAGGVNSEEIVAEAGLQISGKGLDEATAYLYEDPGDARKLGNSLASSGVATEIRGPMLYFVGARAPFEPLEILAEIAEAK